MLLVIFIGLFVITHVAFMFGTLHQKAYTRREKIANVVAEVGWALLMLFMVVLLVMGAFD